MIAPRVSVVMPVHNCVATVGRAVRSVLDQTLPAEEIEIIAVDDGSTDGSGEELDRLAAEHAGLQVIHQSASGGPGRPRNVGLDRAAGEYVFFLDADDHLGPEALERMVAAADEHGTDVVVPKYVGIGRKVNPLLFRKTVPFTTIYDDVPNLYGSLTVLKLYRRRLLEDRKIRFPEGVLSGEDQIFAVRGYFEASGVTVLADYDYYYWVERHDGTSALQKGGAPAATYFPQIAELLAYVTTHTEPGEVRDRLLCRHFAIEVFSRFDPRYSRFDQAERDETKAAVRELVRTYGNPAVMAELSPYMRLLDHLLRNGPESLIDEAARVHATEPPPIVVDGEHAYVAYPGFHDERAQIPDAVFEVSELRQRVELVAVEWKEHRLAVRVAARIERLDPKAQRAELVIRRRGERGEHRLPLEPVDDGELLAEIDFGEALFAAGRWDLSATIRADKIVREGGLVPGKGLKVTPPGPRMVAVADGTPCVTPYLTKASGALALHVGSGRVIQIDRAAVEGRSLRLEGRVAAAVAVPVTLRTVLRHRSSGQTRSAGLEVSRDVGTLAFAGMIGLRGLAPGKWDVWCEVSDGVDGLLRAGLSPTADLPDDRPDGRFGQRAQAFRTVKDNLSVEVRAGLFRRVRRLVHA
ncbi:glycosyltransferase family 2 protein [Actinomadura sp. 6N118]|uniref:glycosyltransferase family 2 protein n=1 Tax=Actinomadura sp. 6N118 TaxID=3375151 RepID=UPI003795D2F9